MLSDVEAKMAIRACAEVGTSNVVERGVICPFVTGYLVRGVKKNGKKHFLFRDKHGEIEVTRPASAFIFMK